MLTGLRALEVWLAFLPIGRKTKKYIKQNTKSAATNIRAAQVPTR